MVDNSQYITRPGYWCLKSDNSMNLTTHNMADECVLLVEVMHTWQHTLCLIFGFNAPINISNSIIMLHPLLY